MIQYSSKEGYMYRVARAGEYLFSMSLVCYVAMGVRPVKFFKYISIASSLAAMVSFAESGSITDSRSDLVPLAAASAGFYLLTGVVDNFFGDDSN